MNLQGTYTDITEIGAGGGGTVFKAFHIRMQKYVVLKKIHESIKDNVDIRGELDVLKNLRHEYLPTVLDFIEDDNSIYTVMDYIPGESFESLINKGVRFTQAQVAKYAAQLGQVLVYLHGQKTPIIHGDIKPANIMLTPEDNICLIDFNISQLQNGIVSQNMGYTPGYASPEQTRIVLALQQYFAGMASTAADTPGDRQGTGTMLLDTGGQQRTGTMLLDTGGQQGTGTMLLDFGTKADTGTMLLNSDGQVAQQKFPMPVLQEKMDARSDIYSAGATLYALLCGNAPAADFAQVVPIQTVVENCSEGLARLINKSMEFAPENRFRSAEEFVKAVSGIAKVNRRYRGLVLRQSLAAIGCIIGIAGCSLLAILGREEIGKEKIASYKEIITKMEKLRVEGKQREEQFENLYAEATENFPELPDAYYQKAIGLYECRMFAELEDYIREDVLEQAGNFSDSETARFYFLLANACMEQDDLEEAITFYRTAIKYDAEDSTYYSDYAIALARSGDLNEAGRVLERAVQSGLSSDRVLLAQGEIAARQNEKDKAAGCFEQCIRETGDSYMILRAYLLWGKMYDNSADESELLQKIKVLTEGVGAVEKSDRAVVLEQLAQGYIDLGALTQNQEYNRKAVDALKEIATLGWDTFVTHNNIGILYQTMGEFESARQEFESMLNFYGEDYRIYKRLAFLEIEVQAAKENSNRDYGQFQYYYDLAEQLFANSNVRADSDMEMQMLDQVYDQLRDGNWLSD